MRKGNVHQTGVAIAETLGGSYVHCREPLIGNARIFEDGYAFACDRKICLLTTNNDRGRGDLRQSDDGLHFDRPTLGVDTLDT